MTNFSGGSLSQALNGRKGPFFAFLAKFNVKASSQNPTLSLWRNTAESVCDKLDFVSVYGHRSSGHKRPRTSFLAARMPDGTLTATQLWEGTCNTEIFNRWCRQFLCPLLNDTSVIVMDNAAFHKSKATREFIEEKGAKLLFLPAYSPELNPIEHDFGAIKKIREYNHQKSIDNIIKMYKSFGA